MLNYTLITVARIYLCESSPLLQKTLDYLIKEINVRGVSVFRAIEGFGEHNQHSAILVDLSLDLPLVIEFFDDKSKVEAALEHLSSFIKPRHILCWEANLV